MAQTQRQYDPRPVQRAAAVAPALGFNAGGEVGRMQADLARRLVGPQAQPGPGEKVVRFLSVAGGYGALAAGYAAVGWAILR